jgi:hypothetical protein
MTETNGTIESITATSNKRAIYGHFFIIIFKLDFNILINYIYKIYLSSNSIQLIRKNMNHKLIFI